jgi:hypothetical protein
MRPFVFALPLWIAGVALLTSYTTPAATAASPLVVHSGQTVRVGNAYWIHVDRVVCTSLVKKLDGVEVRSGGEYLHISTEPAMLHPRQCNDDIRIPGINILATAAKVSQETNVHLSFVVHWDTLNGPVAWPESTDLTILP